MPLGAYRLGSFAGGPTRTAWTLAAASTGTTLPTTATTQVKWGTTSINFTGTNTVSFSKSGTTATTSIASGGLIPIGSTVNYTVECWYYQTVASTQYGVFDAGPGGVAIGIHPGNRIYMGNSGQTYGLISADTTAGRITLNGWTHIAFMRTSGVPYVFVNGVAFTTTGTFNYSFTNPWSGFTMPSIGPGPGASTLRGFVVDFRVSSAAIYSTSGFTVPQAPLTNLESTVLLIPGYDGTVQDDPTK